MQVRSFVPGLVPGLLLGAAAVWLFGARGRTHRAILRDKAVSTGRRAVSASRGRALDASRRAHGMVHDARKRKAHEHVPDEKLVERVRAKLGHVCTRAHAVQVEARDGRVVLRGAMLRREHAKVLAALAKVPGVDAVVDELQLEPDDTSLPALQGGRRPRRDATSITGPVMLVLSAIASFRRWRATRADAPVAEATPRRATDALRTAHADATGVAVVDVAQAPVQTARVSS